MVKMYSYKAKHDRTTIQLHLQKPGICPQKEMIFSLLPLNAHIEAPQIFSCLTSPLKMVTWREVRPDETPHPSLVFDRFPLEMIRGDKFMDKPVLPPHDPSKGLKRDVNGARCTLEMDRSHVFVNSSPPPGLPYQKCALSPLVGDSECRNRKVYI